METLKAYIFLDLKEAVIGFEAYPASRVVFTGNLLTSH